MINFEHHHLFMTFREKSVFESVFGFNHLLRGFNNLFKLLFTVGLWSGDQNLGHIRPFRITFFHWNFGKSLALSLRSDSWMKISGNFSLPSSSICSHFWLSGTYKESYWKKIRFNIDKIIMEAFAQSCPIRPRLLWGQLYEIHPLEVYRTFAITFHPFWEFFTFGLLLWTAKEYWPPQLVPPDFHPC